VLGLCPIATKKPVMLISSVFCVLLFITLSACGKRGALERPPPDDNLEPAEVELNN